MVFAAFMQHCIQSYSFCYSCRRCRRCQILWIIDQRLKIHTNIFLLITSLIFYFLCKLKHVEDVEDYLWHLRHAFIYTVFDGMVGKLLVSAFQNLLQIENQLNIKKVMSKDVCVCSFPIFDVFDIHCITALHCIWSIFDIDSITFRENENDISNTFNMSHTLYQNVCVCSFPIFDIFDIHSITTLRSIWSIFDIFSIYSFTFKENQNDIFDPSN